MQVMLIKSAGHVWQRVESESWSRSAAVTKFVSSVSVWVSCLYSSIAPSSKSIKVGLAHSGCCTPVKTGSGPMLYLTYKNGLYLYNDNKLSFSYSITNTCKPINVAIYI